MKKWLRRMETSTSKEFCLSDKRDEHTDVTAYSEEPVWFYYEEDVKEFIRETISDIEGGFEGEELLNRIKKRAGEKLL
jgi:hypothetical protein